MTRTLLPPTSLSGTLPMLLLSVLPPVIPRASWPSAECCVLGHGVTFNSEPKLDEVSAVTAAIVEPVDEESAKQSVFGKLLNMLPSRSARKSSSVSYAGGGTGGIAAALKVHMGYIAGLVPSNKSRSSSLDSSCNASRYCVRRDVEEENRRVSTLFKDDSDDDTPQTRARSAQSLSHRVSFSIQHQHSQPVLRVRGSPRFPHRIVPTCSLDALEERLKSGNLDTGFVHRNNHLLPQRIGEPSRSKCRSLEDASHPTQELTRSSPLS